MSITIYTDGGCNPNPGPGGWAALIILPDGREKILSGSHANTTNNRMELTAALRALQATPENSEVALHTDSQYLQRGITEWLPNWQRQGWKRGKADIPNRDLWKALAEATQRRKVVWRWVRGHAGDTNNERVHRLASAAIPRTAELPPDDAARIFIRVSCKGQLGAWAARIVQDGDYTDLSGTLSPTTSNRLELLAAIKAIENTPPERPLAIYTGNDYLYKGMTQWLSRWQANNWRTAGGEPVKNTDLWKRLQQLNEQRNITWIQVHTADPPPDYTALQDLLTRAING
ncbi:MAG: hypothetical protein Kow0063_02690 [Anaerolineae bacterium]